VPPISDAMAAVPDAEAKCSTAANITAAELPGHTDAAPTEPTTGTPPLNATFAQRMPLELRREIEYLNLGMVNETRVAMEVEPTLEAEI
jgi:hypothetical protein